jgi:peptidoglycan/LPS O-acetylase OafA/YrhL
MPAPLDGPSWGRSVTALVGWVAFSGIWALFLWSVVERAAQRLRRRRQGKKAGWAAMPEGGPGGWRRARMIDEDRDPGGE